MKNAPVHPTMTDEDADRLERMELEAEEARTMSELRELDQQSQAETEGNRQREEKYKADLRSLLLECEREVRDAKCYTVDKGPPIRIVRVRRGERRPANASFIARPRDTGFDFAVPVGVSTYNEMIESPIFLSDIRRKIRKKTYGCSEEYLSDMRLLLRNTEQFNTDDGAAWVVEHAKLLLEAGEDAVRWRRSRFATLDDRFLPQI